MSRPLLELPIHPHENKNPLHFQTGGTKPARFDVMLSLDNSVKEHIDGIHHAMLHQNVTKLPPKSHISTISNIQVDARHAEAVKRVIEDTRFKSTLNEHTATIFKDRVLRMQQVGCKIMGKDTEELKEAWYAAVFTYPLWPTDEVDPALLAFRTVPMHFLFQGLAQMYPLRYPNLGYGELTERFLVVPDEEDEGFSLILDTGMTTCYFRVPNYEVPLFNNRDGDSWTPHVSLFRLKYVGNRTTSPTLRALIRDKTKLADLEPIEEQKILKEVASAMDTSNVPLWCRNDVVIAQGALYCSFINAR